MPVMQTRGSASAVANGAPMRLAAAVRPVRREVAAEPRLVSAWAAWCLERTSCRNSHRSKIYSEVCTVQGDSPSSAQKASNAMMAVRAPASVPAENSIAKRARDWAFSRESGGTQCRAAPAA